MPIYEYECSCCGKFEEIHMHISEKLERCPKCGKKVKLLISRGSFQLNGSGFYCNDYKNRPTKDEKNK